MLQYIVLKSETH